MLEKIGAKSLHVLLVCRDALSMAYGRISPVESMLGYLRFDYLPAQLVFPSILVKNSLV